MPLIKANGLDIFYDEFGKATDPAILLIMGLATQMIAWPEDLCEILAGEGFRVIRFDNRDIGLSAKIEGAPSYSVPWAMTKAYLGLKVGSPYSLDDMANDALGVLDALGIAKAHIVGASMGGMIAQIIAATHPERCRKSRLNHVDQRRPPAAGSDAAGARDFDGQASAGREP